MRLHCRSCILPGHVTQSHRWMRCFSEAKASSSQLCFLLLWVTTCKECVCFLLDCRKSWAVSASLSRNRIAICGRCPPVSELSWHMWRWVWRSFRETRFVFLSSRCSVSFLRDHFLKLGKPFLNHMLKKSYGTNTWAPFYWGLSYVILMAAGLACPGTKNPRKEAGTFKPEESSFFLLCI